jgi:hypothetical protein
MNITNNSPVVVRHESSANETIIAELSMSLGGYGQFVNWLTFPESIQKIGIDIMLTMGILDKSPKRPNSRQNA